MKVLMALSQKQLTGAESFAVAVGDELTKRGYTVSYVSDTLTLKPKGSIHKLVFNKRSIPRRIWHIAYLVFLIKKLKIDIVHAHSRASSWSCHIACKLTKTPMITSIHGRQPVHKSRKKFHAMGNLALAVCEEIKKQIEKDLNVPSSMVKICRNGIDTDIYKEAAIQAPREHSKPVITIIGRLSGPKGELCYRLLDECLDHDKYVIQVASGTEVPPRFNKFHNKIKFLGYIENIPALIKSSDLIIGAGRVALESVLMHKPIFAIGEAVSVGILTEENLNIGISNNFGDIGPKDLDIEFNKIGKEIDNFFQAKTNNTNKHQLAKVIKEKYSLNIIVNEIENHYKNTFKLLKHI